MANERITEDMVDNALRDHGFYDEPDIIKVEKQQSEEVEAIRAALARASKTGKGGAGYPEFIITSVDAPDMVVVIECKANVSRRASKQLDQPRDYALDGAIHYSRALSPNFSVIGVAVSGTPKGNAIDFFLRALHLTGLVLVWSATTLVDTVLSREFVDGSIA